MAIIPHQIKFDAEIPVVHGGVDYRRMVEELKAIDDIITASKMEDPVIRHWLDLHQRRLNEQLMAAGKRPRELRWKEQTKIQERAITALRATILRKLRGSSLREFCNELALAPLLQSFCRINRFGGAKVHGKSTQESFEKDIPVALVREIDALPIKCAATTSEDGTNVLGLPQPVSLENCYLDACALTANIHFPVDWVLLRDATRTLMLAVGLIRRSGLRNRMPESPEKFLRRINKMSIAMTQASRMKDAKKRRKAVLREMKRFVKRVEGHARLHRDLLENRWKETSYSEKEAGQILKRIDRILERLPAAQAQAHQRIIREEQTKNEDKILSLYDDAVNVIVRRKARASVEFGNTFLLTEQEDGIVVDWELYQDSAPADSRLLQGVLARIDRIFGEDAVGLVGTDRGFDSANNRIFLDKRKIYNAVCPRDPNVLADLMKDPRFVDAQRRRAQTEARIGIMRNNFCGTPMLQRGYAHREQHVAFSVLAHNLWVIARIKLRRQATTEEAQALRRKRA